MDFLRSEHKNSNEVDENLYSRQLYVLGRAAQKRLQGGSVLLTGEFSGLGCEIAKNLILAGVKSLTLHDDRPCTVADLSSNCFLRKQAVLESQPRSLACLQSLQELNSRVLVQSVTGELSFDESGYGQFNVVVLINGSKELQIEIGDFCHEHGIPFSATGVFGLYGYAFNDFGRSFEVADVDGETEKSGIVLNISNDSNGVVTTNDEVHHGLKDNDLVRFSGVLGMEELNNGVPRRIKLVKTRQYDKNTKSQKLVDGHAFSIGDTSKLGKYLGSGNFEQVKEAVRVKHLRFRDAVERPKLVQNDWIDLQRPKKLHYFFQALMQYREEHGACPDPRNPVSAERVIEYVKSHMNTLSSEDIEHLLQLAKSASGSCCSMSSYFGGIVGQEVVKALTQKFTPINQWLHFSAVECLGKACPGINDLPSLRELSATGASSREVFLKYGTDSKYLGQIGIFGRSFQRKLGSLRCFLVGAGALGCEWIKLLALMGVSTKEDGGSTVVTDMDAIEVSNLNRQFLFRDKHVGKLKAVVAVTEALHMNKHLNAISCERKVAPATESHFNHEFWSSLDVVINALDNVPARVYVDSKCVAYGTPLLESGTLGSKANSLPIVPHLTESYASAIPSEDPYGSIPACTLHAYPNLIEHTLLWARDAVFEKYFHLEPLEAENFQQMYPEKYFESLRLEPGLKLSRLRAVRKVLLRIEPDDHPEKLFPYSVDVSDPVSLRTLVSLSRCRFEELFVNKILLLLESHPLDKVVDDKGTKFWSGKRRPPGIVTFNVEEELHLMFILSSVRIYADIYDVVLPTDFVNVVKGILIELPDLPQFTADGDVTVPENDAQAKDIEKAKKEADSLNGDSLELQCAQEMAKLKSSSSRKAVRAVSFDKDNDENGHMDLIYASALIRARSYGIPSVERLQAKRIVGRIVPAIATTTAMITGSIALELYKLMNEANLNQYRCTNVNLAVNSYAVFEPTPCASKPFGKSKKDPMMNVNLWTMLTLEGDLTVGDVLEYFREKFEFDVTSISTQGDVALYNDLFGHDERLGKRVSALYMELISTEPPGMIPLTIDGDFAEDEDCSDYEEADIEEELNIPPCRLNWKV